MDIEAISDIPGLDGWLKERDLGGYWGREREEEHFKPHLWKWNDIHRGLMKASEVVSMDQTFRRNIGLRNPSLGGRITDTINMGVQCILPGDVAKAHRHTAAAIRFIVKGAAGAFTTVEGEPIPMETGDLLTTPHWTWHDHCNQGSEMAMWLDGLDVRMAALGYPFREEYSADTQPIGKPEGYSARLMGHAQPRWMKQAHLTPPFRYPWADTYNALTALKEAETPGDPYDSFRLMFTHPLTGGPTLPTFACEIQLLLPRLKGETHRHNSTTIYHAFRGEGMTTVDGERLEWSQGDIFVVPRWAWHSHENPAAGDDAILFSMTDWPSMQALGLYREETA